MNRTAIQYTNTYKYIYTYTYKSVFKFSMQRDLLCYAIEWPTKVREGMGREGYGMVATGKNNIHYDNYNIVIK